LQSPGDVKEASRISCSWVGLRGAEGPVKNALITGITGQDGSYLTEYLLGRGYNVHGIVRRTSTFNRERIEHLWKESVPLTLHYGDMTDQSSIIGIMQNAEPDEIYNLAAQSHVKVSFEEPEYTANSDGLGTLRILEVIKSLGMQKKVKYYQASTSEMFGNVPRGAQSELTPFAPQSPYAAAKVYAYWITVIYRKAYGLFACNGLLFNHESPRRGESFVTRKITLGVSRISLGIQDFISLGSLDAQRDWGYAPEYVEAMWMMLQQENPDDYVIATGETHTVRDFVEEAFRCVGVSIDWHGAGIEEIGVDTRSGAVRVRIDPNYYRPLEVNYLQGDPTRAEHILGWKAKVLFKDLVALMMKEDLARAAKAGDRYSFYG
jgi:GDPmannose 4,6-dehydratase